MRNEWWVMQTNEDRIGNLVELTGFEPVTS